MKDLYYELTDNGYHIYDRNDPLFHVYQYEPYIPEPSKSYEENAKLQIEELSKDIVPEERYTLDEAAAIIANEVSAK